MSRFTLPRDIYYGANALENLKNLKGSRAVLVLGGGSMKKFGFVDKALGYLKEAGIETRLIENVEPDPSVETVMSGAAVMREFEPDWIISMGGGSPIDAAKAMWASYIPPTILAIIAIIIYPDFSNYGLGTVFAFLFQGGITGWGDKAIFPNLKHQGV